MQQFIDSYIGALSGQFYINQVITILLLIVYGLIFVSVIRGKNISVLDYILVYPMALVTYSIAGYTLLSTGISFNKYSVIIVMAVLLILVALLSRKNPFSGINKNTFIYVVIMVILTLVAVSGIIPISATNDSMYFFSEYPRALVHYGKLTSILDNFLTDASQGIAIIGTLPFFYGFDEIYGIQTLLNLNFYFFFAYIVFDYSKSKLNKKLSFVISVMSVFILFTSMPFVLMSRWFMANAFFMEYMAIIVYLAYAYCKNGIQDKADMLILSVLITGLSIMRMEGALNVGVLVLCIMILEYKNRDIVVYLVAPTLVLQALYLYRIFYVLTLHTAIQFMTIEKAYILITFLICIILYTLIIRGRLFTKYEKYYSYILIAGLCLVNGAVLLYDRSDYITNIKAFIGNMIGNSGWGVFVAFSVGVIMLVPKKSIKLNYFDFTAICYILLTLVAGWARGDSLYKSFGDSGNRIMIQAVPIIILVLIIKIVDGLEYWKKEDLN